MPLSLRRSVRPSFGWLFATMLGSANLISLPLIRAEPKPAFPKILKVAAVQMRSGRDRDANVRKTIDHLERCAKKGAAVVVFPECSLTGYYADVIRGTTKDQIERAIRSVADACKANKIAAIVGTPTRDGEKLFNSAIVIDAKGTVVERYHKNQVAEDWPVDGDHLSVFHLNGVPCSIIICHDERYPELVRLPVLAGARVVFYLSHESGIQSESKIGPYRAQIQARAVENTVYIAHANAPANADSTGSHGHSRLIAPDGNILREASIFQEDVLFGEFDLAKATRRNATRSATRGPLAKWYEDGIKQVKILRD